MLHGRYGFRDEPDRGLDLSLINSWFSTHHTEVLQKVLRQDRRRERSHGRGNLSLSRSLRGGVGVVLVGGRIRDAVAVLARVKETSSRVVNGGDIV